MLSTTVTASALTPESATKSAAASPLPRAVVTTTVLSAVSTYQPVTPSGTSVVSFRVDTTPSRLSAL